MELLLETGVAAAIVPELAWMFGGMEGLTAAGGQPPIRAPGMPDDIARIRRAQAWRVLEELDSIGKQLSHASAPPSGGGTPHPTNALVLAAVVAPFLPDLAAGDDESARDQFILIEHVLGPVAARLRASRRDAERARHILLAQRRLAPSKRKRMRPMALVRRDFFGEALGLYELMARASGTVAAGTAANSVILVNNMLGRHFGRRDLLTQQHERNDLRARA